MELTQISDLTPSARGEVMSRGSELAAIESDVKQIIDNVRADGDAALREFSREFDDVEMNAIEVTGAATKAVETIHSDVQAAIASTIDRIETFHRHQLRDDWQADFDGRTLGRQFRPIERAGAYVPGGSAAYPSTAMMTVVPARVAGVNTIIAVPPADPINKVTLAALSLAGVDRIFAAGGAQGIAALAYGTESIPAVDTIVGPGNRWVAAAKAAVQGDVSIDMIAGPSEVLILADETADPEFVASDLIAQAEHDPHASAAAVTPDLELAKRIGDAVRDQLPKRTRGGVAESAFSNESSGIFVAESMDQAVEFTNEYAVEHLGIMTADNESIVEQIKHAGSIFVGEYSPVAAGDYSTGPNHVLPTAQTARVSSGLSVDTFMRSRTVQHLDKSALKDINETITTLAELEGLEAHAESIQHRID
jgi:histidinol dehydrogenase